jgi:hypothetical protein
VRQASRTTIGTSSFSVTKSTAALVVGPLASQRKLDIDERASIHVPKAGHAPFSARPATPEVAPSGSHTVVLD